MTRFSRYAAAWLLAVFGALPGARAETVLITGSNQGIGLEFAKEYAAKGWTVIATHRRDMIPEELARLRSHVEQFREALESNEEVGKRLAGEFTQSALIEHIAGQRAVRIHRVE